MESFNDAGCSARSTGFLEVHPIPRIPLWPGEILNDRYARFNLLAKFGSELFYREVILWLYERGKIVHVLKAETQ